MSLNNNTRKMMFRKSLLLLVSLMVMVVIASCGETQPLKTLSKETSLRVFYAGQEVAANSSNVFSVYLPSYYTGSSTQITFKVAANAKLSQGNTASANNTPVPTKGDSALYTFTTSTLPSDPVSFVVTAEDGKTSKIYSLFFLLSTPNDNTITSFGFTPKDNPSLSQYVDGKIAGNIITVSVPKGTNITTLIPTIIFSGKSVNPESAVPQDFSTDKTYTVTAQDGSSRSYSVKVVVLQASEYTVTFDSKGGSPASFTQSVSAGSSTLAPSPAPTKNDSTLEGWYNGNTKFDFATPITSDLSLTAKWKPITYTVAFDSKGGVPTPNDTSIEKGNLLREPRPAPTKTDSLLEGWYNGPTKFDFSTTISSNLILTAKWVKAPSSRAQMNLYYDGKEYAASNRVFNITLPSNYNSQAASLSLTLKISTFASLARKGSSTNTPISTTGDSAVIPFDITSLPRSQEYLVTAENGSSSQSYTISVAKAAATSKDITGFAFSASTNPGKLSQDVNSSIAGTTISLSVPYGTTISALVPTISISGKTIAPASGVAQDFSSRKTYTVTAEDGSSQVYNIIVTILPQTNFTISFDARGGNPVPTSKTVSLDASIAEPTIIPLKTDSTFIGWFKADGTQFNFSSRISSDLTLYAKYKIKSFTVTFNAMGGTPTPTPLSIDKGSTISTIISAPTKGDSVLIGWFKADGAIFDFNTPITEDFTLYAKWKIITYSISYDVKGGTPSFKNETISRGATATLPSPEPTKGTDSILDAWYNGNTKFNFNTPITSNLVLVARWKIATYTLTFDVTGGSPSIAARTVARNALTSAPSPPPTKGSDSILDAWYNGNTKFDFNTPITSNLALVARWKIITYTLTFTTNGGSALASLTVNRNTKAAIPTPPTRTGYSFDGWYSDAALTVLFDFNTPITASMNLYAKWGVVKNTLQDVLTTGVIPTSLTSYDEVAQSSLKPYAPAKKVKAIYVTVAGGNTAQDGSSWTTSYAAASLKAAIDNIQTSNTDTVYLVLLGVGTYPVSSQMSMKNNVAIIGGFEMAGGWTRPASDTTRLDGQQSNRIFYNTDLDNTALLYGVTIQNGKISGYEDGGGMYNENASPTITHVSFNNNTANSGSGGGIYNYESSPILTHVSFNNNTANSRGGGIFNLESSSPILTNVFFNNNTATYGGGMLNETSSPTITNVSFNNNTANYNGGGIYNRSSSPNLANVTFSSNTAGQDGGAMYQESFGTSILTNVVFSGNVATQNGGAIYTLPYRQKKDDLKLVNCILWGNTAASSGNDFYVDVSRKQNNDTTKLILAYTIYNASGVAAGGGTAPFQKQDISVYNDNPTLTALADNGGFVRTIKATTASAVQNRGIYVKRRDSSAWFSLDKVNWYKDFDPTNAAAAGGFLASSKETPPTDAVDLDQDATGYIRRDRPDLGAVEYR